MLIDQFHKYAQTGFTDQPALLAVTDSCLSHVHLLQ